MTTKPIGLYLHIPFCIKKCSYCDFCSYPASELGREAEESYVKALIGEIESYKRKEVICVDTVFFGGGTPSLLSTDSLEKIFSAIRSTFAIAHESEITLEANPGTLTEEKLCAYRAQGVNRLSMGLQSIHENELKKLGRIHSYSDFLTGYALARKVGFNNISVDLMYGIPDQTLDSFRETLDMIIALTPEHISAYGLIVEEGTPFFDNCNRLNLPDEDAECDMYALACDRLRSAGYSHYEISNYARAGRESQHNLHYWHSDEYIGVGVSAHSYFENRRFSSSRDFSEYLKDFKSVSSVEPAADEGAFECAMLALRLSEGLSLADYESRFSHSFTDGREADIRRYIDLGYMTLRDGRLALTERGFYVSNAILSDLL